MRVLLEHGRIDEDIDVPQRSTGLTPLMICAKRGDADGVALLLEFGADPAVVDGTVGACVNAMLLHGCTIGTGSSLIPSTGRNALHFAVLGLHTAVVDSLAMVEKARELVDAQSILFCKSATVPLFVVEVHTLHESYLHTASPLVLAASTDDATIFDRLLPLASWPNIVEAMRNACLAHPRLAHRMDMIKAMFRRASAMYREAEEQALSQHRFPLTFAVPGLWEEKMDLFIKHAFLVNVDGLCSQTGRAAIHRAVRYADVKMVERVLAAGADVAVCDVRGKGVFHFPAMSDAPEAVMVEIVKKLVGARSFDPAILKKTYQTLTPVAHAIIRGKLDVASAMAEAILEKEKEQPQGPKQPVLSEREAREILKHHRNAHGHLAKWKYLSTLLSNWVSMIPHLAAVYGAEDVLKKCEGYSCFSSSVSLTFRGQHMFFTPLCAAAAVGNERSVRMLLNMESVRRQINVTPLPGEKRALCHAVMATDPVAGAGITMALLEAGAWPGYRAGMGYMDETLLDYVKRLHGRNSAFKDVIKWMEVRLIGKWGGLEQFLTHITCTHAQSLVGMDDKVLLMNKARATAEMVSRVPPCLGSRKRLGRPMPRVEITSVTRKTRRGKVRTGVLDEEFSHLNAAVNCLNDDMFKELMAFMTPKWLAEDAAAAAAEDVAAAADAAQAGGVEAAAQPGVDDAGHAEAAAVAMDAAEGMAAALPGNVPLAHDDEDDDDVYVIEIGEDGTEYIVID